MSRNRLASTIVTIFCEGKTEEFYLKNLFKDYPKPSKKYVLKSVKNNSYKSLASLIERNDKLDDIIIVIMDLDRVAKDDQEYKHLERLIKIIKKKNVKKKKNESHIFLTYPNFEDWLRYHFKILFQKKNYPKNLAAKTPKNSNQKKISIRLSRTKVVI